MWNDPAPGDADDYDPKTARTLIAEAFHTFGEEAAFSLALLLGVEFEECAEDIERARRRLH